MNISELNFIAGLLKKAKSFFIDINNTTEVLVPAHANNHEHATGGVCRTPADAVALRMNMEPWS